MMITVHAARFLIGLSLLIVPAVSFADDGEGTSSGSVVLENETGSLLLRLATVAEGALPLKNATRKERVQAAWMTSGTRYTERRTELHLRCHDDLRRANKDTIVRTAAACLRSDLLLEMSYRREERLHVAATPGIDAPMIDAVTFAIDGWIDVASVVIDGIDAGVFTTVDTLKAAKRNLHETYRIPMLTALARFRSAEALALTRALAHDLQIAFGDTPPALLATIVPCLEQVQDTLTAGASSTGDAAMLRAGLAELRTCVSLVKEEQ